jgi:hypothetical protein
VHLCHVQFTRPSVSPTVTSSSPSAIRLSICAAASRPSGHDSRTQTGTRVQGARLARTEAPTAVHQDSHNCAHRETVPTQTSIGVHGVQLTRAYTCGVRGVRGVCVGCAWGTHGALGRSYLSGAAWAADQLDHDIVCTKRAVGERLMQWRAKVLGHIAKPQRRRHPGQTLTDTERGRQYLRVRCGHATSTSTTGFLRLRF